MIVLDASAGVELLLGSPRSAPLQDLLLAGETLRAQPLLDVEILQALLRLVLLHELTPGRAAEALLDLSALTVERWARLSSPRTGASVAGMAIVRGSKCSEPSLFTVSLPPRPICRYRAAAIGPTSTASRRDPVSDVG